MGNAATAPAGSRRSRVSSTAGRPTVALVLLVVLAITPLLVAIVHLLVTVPASWPSEGDIALIERHVRGIPGTLPLLGPYSRFGWNHPGPLLYYVLAIPYRLLGSHSVDLFVGALLVNAAAVAGIVVVAVRAGGRRLALGATTLLLIVMHALGPEFLRSPWNPDLALLPFALFIVLIGLAATGSGGALVTAAAVGTFVVQCHAGYALIVLSVGACGTVGWALARHARRDDPGTKRKTIVTVAVGVGVLFVLWLPPLVQQFTGDRPNLSALARYSLDHPSDHSAHDVAEALADQFDWRAEWYAGNHGFNPILGEIDLSRPLPFPVWLLPFAAGIVVVVRRRRRTERWWYGSLLVALGAAAASLYGMEGFFYPYVVHWRLPIGALVSATGVATLWSLLTPEHRVRFLRVGVPATLALAVLFAGAATVDAVQADRPAAAVAGPIAASRDAILDAIPPTGGPVLVQFLGSITAGGYEMGLITELEKHGIPVAVRASDQSWYEDPPPTVTGTTPRATVTIVDTESFDNGSVERPPGEIVARTPTVTVFVAPS